MDKDQAISLIRGCSLAAHADLLIQNMLPSARVIVLNDSANNEDTGCSQFGGAPSLPRGESWPVWDRLEYATAEIARLEKQFKDNPRATALRDIALQMRKDLSRKPLPLLFLGQLSLSEIHAVAPLPGWPSDGTLLFFCDPSIWGFDPLARRSRRVLYFSARDELVPASPPKELGKVVKFPRRRLGFKREWTLPTHISEDGVALSIWENDDYGDLCTRLTSSLRDDEPIHRCGGHPREIQGEMRLECQLVTNGIYCGNSAGYQDPRRAVLEKGAADWQLLIQIDSDEKRLGWMWGDMGRIYFWARQQDIEAVEFDGSWAILQCY